MPHYRTLTGRTTAHSSQGYHSTGSTKTATGSVDTMKKPPPTIIGEFRYVRGSPSAMPSILDAPPPRRPSSPQDHRHRSRVFMDTDRRSIVQNEVAQAFHDLVEASADVYVEAGTDQWLLIDP